MIRTFVKAVGIAATTSAAVASTAFALGAPAVAAPANQGANDFSLSRQAYPAADALPLAKTSMTAVIKKGGYQAQRGGACGAAIKGKSAPAQWYCFDSKDKSTRKKTGDPAPVWIPQAVTSTADAADSERWNGLDAVAVGWYDDADVQGIRITVLNKATGKYDHVLLVNPYFSGSRPTYRAVDVAAAGRSTFQSVHIGGMAWYGRRLYVVDTSYGIREFSLDRIFDLKASQNGFTDQPRLIGYRQPRINNDPDRPAGYYAHGYRYIMPQTAMWKHPGAPSDQDGFCQGEGNPRFSYMSVDRKSSPHRLIVGEYCHNTKGRVVAYQMTGEQPSIDRDGRALPDEVHKLPVAKVQGAASDGRYWYFNSSDGRKSGILRRAALEGGRLKVDKAMYTPVGPEDLSYSRKTRQLWSVTEHYKPGRMIYSLPLKNLVPAKDLR